MTIVRSMPRILLAVLGAAVTFAAGAQDAPPPPPPPAEGADAAAQDVDTLGAVLVTAERRSADAQKTAIAMTVVDGEQLVASGVSDLRSIEAVAPDLNVRTDTLFTHFAIRGVGSSNNGELADAGVTVGLDGEYFNRPVALNASMMDIQRVEVLRGPQGTLYGRNATAGAINIITNKPEQEFSGGLSIEGGDYSALNAQGYLNVPLGEKFAARLAAMTASHDGYLDNAPGGDGEDQDVTSARLSLQANLTDNLTILLAGDYSEVDQTATQSYGVSVRGPPYNLPTGSTPANIEVDVPEEGWPLASLGNFNSEQKAGRATVEYDFGGATLTYLGAYRDNQTESVVPLNGFIPELFLFDNNFTIRTESHELRLGGGEDGGFLWQAGLFYAHENQDVARGLFLRSPPLPPQFANGYINYFVFPDIISESQAAYAQMSFQFTDQWKATIGGRYTTDKKERDGASFPPPGPPLFLTNQFPNHPTNPALGVDRARDGEWSKPTWLVGLDWQVQPENLIYAKVSTGFKSGGFDNFTDFDPENLLAMELGSKNRFLDDRLQLNFALFNYDYEDQQVSVFIDTTVGAQIINAGASTVRGFETDLTYAVGGAGRLRFTANYLDAEFDELIATEPRVGVDPSTANPQTVDLAGNEPIQSPEWTLTAGYDHVFDLPNGASLTGTINSRYKTDYWTSVFNWNPDKQDAISNTDVSLMYSSPKGSWDFTVFARNLEDERPMGFSGFTGGPTVSIYNFVLAGAPRTYGARASVRF